MPRPACPRPVLLLLLVAACDCSDDGGVAACMFNSDCDEGSSCVEGRCILGGLSDATTDGGPDAELDGNVLSCEPPTVACAGRCCAEGQTCSAGVCTIDCGEAALCAGVCCAVGQACELDRCVAECSDVSQRCGASDELCCTTDQACLGDSCVDLGENCDFTEDCEVDEICLPSEGRCANRDSVDVCEFRPPDAPLEPRLGCRWAPAADDPFPLSDAVEMTPSVANLTDDNGDGVTNTLDTPDIVFATHQRREGGTCCRADAVIRIVSGDCQPDGTMRTIATLPAVDGDLGPDIYDGSNSVLVANLHPDSMPSEQAPELVTSRRARELIAWRRTADDGSTWEVMWRANVLDNTRVSSGMQPGAADFNGDGQPEVYVGNVVLNGLTGEVIWDGDLTVGTGSGVGNNAFLGPVSTAADLDLDGTVELIAGNTVYNGIDGSLVWQFELPGDLFSICQGGTGCDGYDAIGNFDDDDEAEVVIIVRGEAFILEHDGTLKHRIRVPWEDCADDMSRPRNESGPPTIADFDGDGRAEIGTAGADFYTVLDLDCLGDARPAECESDGILWSVANQDCSSRATGSSVFDFEGDGAAEVVYADETNFRVLDGRTGAILLDDDTHSSNTRMEMPIVVDVDNDGRSEIVVPEPNGDENSGGIEIFEDTNNNWVRTRRIWNQHSYHVTNITEDGQVPRNEEPNWLNGRLNNFRQNVQPGGLFDAPDLVVTAVARGGCEGTSAQIRVTVSNTGALGAAAGVPVAVYATLMGSEEELVGVLNTTRLLLPGQSETLVIGWTPSGGWLTNLFSARAVVDSDGEGGSVFNECNEDNNEGTSADGLTGCGLG
ncbi:MAG: CARDB domain-containing protein [Myxococcota bacterium]